MQLRAEITAVETLGESIKITAQTTGLRDAQWRSYGKMKFTIAQSKPKEKEMYLGRKLKINIEAA